VGKPEGKRPLGSPRCRWVDNIKKAVHRKEINLYIKNLLAKKIQNFYKKLFS
jgi:late competence protein required for DNA uptake (superfamily II DNA/RNA helicase)